MGRKAPIATTPWFAIARNDRLHSVIGDVHHGVRIDIAGAIPPLALDRLIFPLRIATAPRQLVEFRRLVSFARGQPLSTRKITPRLRRLALGLQVIDAMSEGASLREIGEAFVRAGDWPGAGESTKSKARRLVTVARRMWIGGPKGVMLDSLRSLA